MWTLIYSGFKMLIGGYFDMKKSQMEYTAAYNRQELSGEQNYDLQAQKNAQTSWKDEILMLIWFAPMVLGWWDEDGKRVSATEWVAFANSLPYWWWFGSFGIIAATFGLRWYFKRQNFKMADMKLGATNTPSLGIKKE